KGQFLYNGPSLRLQGRVAEGRVRVREGRSIPASAGTILVDLRFCRSKDPFSFSCEGLSVLCTVAAPTPLLPRSGTLSRPCTRMCSTRAWNATWAGSPQNLGASGSGPRVQRAQDRTGRRQDPAVRSVTVVGVTADHPAPLQAQHPAADPPHRPKKGANAPITWPRPRLSVADHRPKRADSALRFSRNPTRTTHPRRRLRQP